MDKSKNDRAAFSQAVFRALAWILVCCIAVQTLLAGMAIFNDPDRWSSHVIFVRIFEYVPLLMLIFAFTGRLPVRTRWLSFALFAMIIVQYATANVSAVGALHPVMALVMAVLSLYVAMRGVQKKQAE